MCSASHHILFLIVTIHFTILSISCYQSDCEVISLQENVADPDHGMFAHQSTQFDKHAASTEHPMKVEAGRRLGRATITSSTPGQPSPHLTPLQIAVIPHVHARVVRGTTSKHRTSGNNRSTTLLACV